MGCLETSTHHFPGISRQSWRWFLSVLLTSYFPSIDEFAYGSYHAATVYSMPCFCLINDHHHCFSYGMGRVGPVAPPSHNFSHAKNEIEQNTASIGRHLAMGSRSWLGKPLYNVLYSFMIKVSLQIRNVDC